MSSNLAEDILPLNDMAVKRSFVEKLTLTDFRNYRSLRLNAGPGIIVLTGENGSGKTNILEAISYLSPGRGLRGARLADIRRIAGTPTAVGTHYMPAGAGWAVNAIVSTGCGERIELATAIERASREDGIDGGGEESRAFERRIVKIDGMKVTSQAELGKHLSLIWLTPQMDRLFRGGSQPRRSFLDRLVFAFDIEHARRVTLFEQSYREWLQLLKVGSSDNHWLAAMEDSMAAHGAAIAAARRDMVSRLNRFIETEPEGEFPGVVLELEGTIEKMLDSQAAVDVEDFYRDLLFKSRRCALSSDWADGVNRTDFKVFHRGKKMPAELCSTGEQKALLVSIILAQAKCVMGDRGFAPVLLLDEAAAHLDDARREALLGKIADMDLQAWITSTDESLFSSLKGRAQFIHIENGKIANPCP